MNTGLVFRVLIVLILLSGPALADGPFGLRMGMSLDEVGASPEEVRHGLYKFTSVPRPHSGFEAYILKFAPSTGLCWIKAVGVNIQDNAYGTALRSGFSTLKEQLSTVYGQPRDMDFLMPGSIWDEPREYMMALLRKERVLGAIWDLDGERNLRQVGLIASALRRDVGYLSLEYSFTNKDACDEELQSMESQVF
ncbi:MAG: hypothetical protein EA399_11535 [Desulfovibrionales bacterium]|nr:MAG: hypothetical protein EA399_11535 [Desulfovibrionales bacterium]